MAPGAIFRCVAAIGLLSRYGDASAAVPACDMAAGQRGNPCRLRLSPILTDGRMLHGEAIRWPSSSSMLRSRALAGLLPRPSNGDWRERSRHLDLGDGGSGLAIDMLRARVGRMDDMSRLASGSRGGALASAMSYGIALDGIFALRLSAGMALTRIRLPTFADNGHTERSLSHAVTLSLTRNRALEFDAGWYRAAASSGRSPIDRAIALAAGAPAAGNGARLAIYYAPAGLDRGRGLRIGFEAGDFTLDARDAFALGTAHLNDRRAAFSLAIGF